MSDFLLPVTGKDQCARLFEALKSQWTDGASIREGRFVGFQGVAISAPFSGG